MGMFGRRTSEDDRTARDQAAAISKRDGLAERLAAAEIEIAGSRAAVDKLARDAADDSELDAALSRKRIAEDKAAALAAALANASKVVADLEAQAAAAADKRTRAATAQAIEQIARNLETLGAEFDNVCTRYAAEAKRAADIVLDAAPLASYLATAATETRPAGVMLGEVLRHQAALVLNGTAKAALPMPEKTPPRPRLVEAPKLERVFAMKHLCFTEPDGTLRRHPKMTFVDLSPEHARRALSLAWAIPMNDERARKLNGAYGTQIPVLAWCCDLNSGQAAASQVVDVTPSRAVAPPMKSQGFGNFEPMDRGKPFNILVPTTAAEPMPAAASRSLPAGDDA